MSKAETTNTVRLAMPFKDAWLGVLISAAVKKANTFHFRGRPPYVPSTRERRKAEIKASRKGFALA